MAGDWSVLENVDITKLKCPKFFSQDGKLRMHLCNKPCTWIQCPKNYTGEKPYYKSFVIRQQNKNTSKNKCIQEMRINTREKQFSYMQCPKTF